MTRLFSRFLRTLLLGVAVLSGLAAIGIGACSFAEFEISPYTPRGVDIVYSQQENLTFLVWRVDRNINFNRVHFELFVDGQYREIDPAQAPFPSQPYDCDRLYSCVQFQIPGRWNPPPARPPLRAVDRRHGVFPSTAPRVYDVQTTFDIAPVGVDNNHSARPRLADWFSEEKIPLERTFQWGLVSASPGSPCPTEPPPQWDRLQSRVTLPQNWMSDTPCMVVRPDRLDQPGSEVRRHLVPGAMLHTEPVNRLLPEIEHPTLVAFLIDLEVVNDQRCEMIVDQIGGQIFDALDELDAPYRELGLYRPVDPDGTSYSGCSQREGSRYPIDELVVQSDQVAASIETPSTLAIVYLNNLSLPPGDAKIEDLSQLFEEQEEDANPRIFNWLIGSSASIHWDIWDASTPWGPIEDENFLLNIESTVNSNFSLRSTDFDGDDSIPLFQPNSSQSPQYLRLCTFSPSPGQIELPPDLPVYVSSDTWPWPAEGVPELYFDIPPQEYVPSSDFIETGVTGVYEVCDAYCDGPFEGPDGRVHDSWLDSNNICRW